MIWRADHYSGTQLDDAGIIEGINQSAPAPLTRPGAGTEGMTSMQEKRTGGLEDGLLLRTARKAHKCDGDGSASHRHTFDCPREIKAGQQYIECLWEAPAYQSGSRISLSCAVVFYGWRP